ncbi:hypothetical protein H8E88_26010 [candidate division KSB1 bacterium]|nr:hypothetical protein [candidate division KSB1 bacterium]MBL7094798.1 hypothetical protein [candidate division KSB1 bacterium]
MFPILEEYEKFIYTIPERFSDIKISTLVLKRFGVNAAKLVGKIYFNNNFELSVLEVIDFDKRRVKSYSYEVFRNKEKIYWYDSWSHPNDTSLASTNPHHKHIHPNIKHHRIPAPDLSFKKPNLIFLIDEILRQF